MKKNEVDLVVSIAERATEMGIVFGERITFMIDMDKAVEAFNLHLDDLLNADDFNFTHGICGIQNNINRRTGEFENYFLPRFSGEKQVNQIEHL